MICLSMQTATCLNKKLWSCFVQHRLPRSHFFKQSRVMAEISPPPPPPTLHLIVLLHGIEGNAGNWCFVVEELTRLSGASAASSRLSLLACESNHGRTHDGIDVCGDRAAAEVEAHLIAHPDTTHVSIIAHSLGGMIARRMICTLHASSAAWQHLVKHRFVSLAVPHLGTVNVARMWHIEWLAQWMSTWVPSRTMRQLVLLNDPDRLLFCMATEPAYIDAWRAFSSTHLYANVGHDHLVGGTLASRSFPPFTPQPSAMVCL
jgi:pimeloyl-ACP methyl ester carboxylesterase